MIPIYEKERKCIVDNGSEGFISKLDEIGEKIFSLQRKEVI